MVVTLANIEIYTKPWCPYCRRAKSFLDKKGTSFNEIDIQAEPERRDEMIQRADGGHTVPQIFIDGIHVGGCDDLHELDSQGRLDGMLGLPEP
jgi:glutaredoxin 3